MEAQGLQYSTVKLSGAEIRLFLAEGPMLCYFVPELIRMSLITINFRSQCWTQSFCQALQSVTKIVERTFKGTDHPIKSLDLTRGEEQRFFTYNWGKSHTEYHKMFVEKHSRSSTGAIKNADLISKIVPGRLLFFTIVTTIEEKGTC